MHLLFSGLGIYLMVPWLLLLLLYSNKSNIIQDTQWQWSVIFANIFDKFVNKVNLHNFVFF